MDYIEFRSDASAHPTLKMREAMVNAIVGDDGYKDDPTTNELEKYAAKLLGMDGALIFPTGTMANQCAIMTHTQRIDELIAADKSHIIQNEQGGAAFLCGVVTRTIETEESGLMDIKDIEFNIRKAYDIHFPNSKLVCLENPTNAGYVGDLEYMKNVYELAKKYKLTIHLDGARLFNAAAHLNVEAKEITKYCDSVMFSLTKGLCGPIGSILCGSADFIKKARYYRKLIGGGMRQTGIFAAAGMVGLKDHKDLIVEDNKIAQYLGEQINEKLGDYIEPIDCKNIHVNITNFKVREEVNINSQDMVNYLKEKANIMILGEIEEKMYRLYTHYYIGEKEVNKLVYHMLWFFQSQE